MSQTTPKTCVATERAHAYLRNQSSRNRDWQSADAVTPLNIVFELCSLAIHTRSGRGLQGGVT
jgi:hypothetical protein